MYFGLNTAAAFFFSWLIAQELDPDRKLGGIIGGGLSIVAALTLGEGNVLVLLWLLFILRMLNRTSGSRHKIGDNVFLILLPIGLGKMDIGFIQYLRAQRILLKARSGADITGACI